jgi:hypothetical protein
MAVRRQRVQFIVVLCGCGVGESDLDSEILRCAYAIETKIRWT